MRPTGLPRFLRITRDNLPRWQGELEALEKCSVYPLGDDAFRISHGTSYLAFFERMGEVAYYALEDEAGLAAVGCGVLRPDGGPGLPRRWYVGDLKVRPDARGRHLPVMLLRRAFMQNYLRCGRGYAVAMNPADGRVPPAVRTFAWFKWLPMWMLASFQLDIFSADCDGLESVWPLLVQHRGPVHLVSRNGLKELHLESTGRPLPLLHVRHGKPVDKLVFSTPQAGHTHMWCMPREAPLALALRQAGVLPAASATVVYHRLGAMDWSTLDTSEI
jgi:GNAT superfamily N-acetyltransferase